MSKSNRILSLRGIIDEETTGKLIDTILKMNYDDESNNLVDSKLCDRQPIHLHIQSGGGNVSDAYALIDTILNSETPVYTFCDGYTYSAAVLVYLAGEKRYASKHSWFLIHNITSTLKNLTTQNIHDEAEYLNVLEGQIMDFLVDRTKLTRTELSQKLSHNIEYIITAKQAFDKGIVTDLLS